MCVVFVCACVLWVLACALLGGRGGQGMAGPCCLARWVQPAAVLKDKVLTSLSDACVAPCGGRLVHEPGTLGCTVSTQSCRITPSPFALPTPPSSPFRSLGPGCPSHA